MEGFYGQEIASLRALEVFEEVDLESVPADTKILPTMWIYTVKRVGTHKARLAARGDHQPEADYSAPTIPMQAGTHPPGDHCIPRI